MIVVDREECKRIMHLYFTKEKIQSFKDMFEDSKAQEWLDKNSFDELFSYARISYNISEPELILVLLASDIDFLHYITYIPSRAFSWTRHALKSITLPNNIRYIDNQAFAECYDLDTIELPDDIRYIYWGAFSMCYSLKKIKLPDMLKLISTLLFSGCSSLKSIDIPYGVEAIDTNAFQDCRALEKITIPNTVTFIGEYAFNGCDRLKEIYFDDSKEVWESNVNVSRGFKADLKRNGTKLIFKG